MGRISFAELGRRMDTLQLVHETRRVVLAKKPRILGLVRTQLFEQGIGGDGKKLSRYKNTRYARMKHAMNPKPGLGTPDYRKSSRLYKRMDVIDEGSTYNINSDVPYFKYVRDRDANGRGFAMTKKSRSDFRHQDLKPELRKHFTQRTGIAIK